MSDPIRGIEIKDRKYHLKTYRSCFVGRLNILLFSQQYCDEKTKIASEAVDWMLKNLSCRTREEATKLGEKLVDEGFLEHVCQPQPFKDAYLFFVLTVKIQK